MNYRIRSNGQLVTQGEVRKMFSSTSLPRVWGAELCDHLGIDPILEGPQASVSGPYETSVQQGVEQINGKWFTKYVVGPIFADTTEDGVTTTAAEHEAAYRAQKDATQADAVRSERNTKLAETDWTQAKDIADNISSAWAPYRQALRDITSQAGFPWEVQWPTQPE